MQVIWNAFVSTAVIGLLLFCGYLSGARGWMGKETNAYLSKLLMTIAIPFMCVYNMNTNLSQEMLLGSGNLLLVPFCCAVAAFGLSFAVAKLLQMPRRRVGVFMAMCALNNTMFVGYAMCLEFFGEASVPF